MRNPQITLARWLQTLNLNINNLSRTKICIFKIKPVCSQPFSSVIPRRLSSTLDLAQTF